MNHSDFDFGHLRTIRDLKIALNELTDNYSGCDGHRIVYDYPQGKEWGVYMTFRNGYLVIGKSDLEPR